MNRVDIVGGDRDLSEIDCSIGSRAMTSSWTIRSPSRSPTAATPIACGSFSA